ncbi:MAG TPA: helix-turn-helix domain-containing protein [bacterium]|nr:helix-turn-helix domain-containing protein [bacterium]
MQADLQRELEQLGFTERQACIYITLLRFGKSGAQQLALASGVPRASCYDTLEQLSKQGLVRAMEESGQQVFVTEPPERIGLMLALQLEEVQARRRRAELFLPQLSALTGDGTAKPRFRIINDAEELRMLHEEYADLDKPILQMVGYDAFLELHRESVVQEHAERLQEKRSKGRAILVTDSLVDAPAGSGFEVRCVPAAMMDVKGEMTVCEDHVLLFAYTENVTAIEIISPAIANTCRATLELAWQRAGEIEKLLQ